MRYYLALRAFLYTAHQTFDERFEAHIKSWLDLSENYVWVANSGTVKLFVDFQNDSQSNPQIQAISIAWAHVTLLHTKNA